MIAHHVLINYLVLLIDALTGVTLYTLNTSGGNIEGSPAIYNNQIILRRILCI